MNKIPVISIVIPCYRSAQTITHVVDAIQETMSKQSKYAYEVILVNDGSPDETFSVISGLARENYHIKAVELSRNFGQHSALFAGYALVGGDYVLGMDDDGEHDPHDMFKLIDKLEEGYDYVCAAFPSTDHSFYKKIGSKVNDWMATKYIGKPKNAIFSSYYVMRRYVVDEIIKSNNPNPYVGGMLVSITQKLTSVPIEHKIRLNGRSGYNLINSFSLLINGITSFSVKPLRLASISGIIFAIIGFIFGIFIVIQKLLVPDILAGYSSIISILLFSNGIIMISIGAIGEYIGRTYLLMNKIPQYVIKSVVQKEDELNVVLNEIEKELVNKEFTNQSEDYNR